MLLARVRRTGNDFKIIQKSVFRFVNFSLTEGGVFLLFWSCSCGNLGCLVSLTTKPAIKAKERMREKLVNEGIAEINGGREPLHLGP